MTRGLFYRLFDKELAAVLCADDIQWSTAHNTIVSWMSLSENDDLESYEASHPWCCKWQGELSRWNGQEDCHPFRITYEEFMAIHDLPIVEDVELAGLEELL